MYKVKNDFHSQGVGGEYLNKKGALIKKGKALMASTSVSQTTLHFKPLKYLSSVVWKVEIMFVLVYLHA
jgi:hypothetical protein